MRIGQYAIEREIGRGGMGVVHLARDTRLHRLVAVKTLPASMEQDPDRLHRFRREALLLASLNHPNIAQIHNVERCGGRQHLVLEYVPGEGLDERLARGPLALKEAIELCLQVARGVRAAHEHCVIHRDLKPSNVRITPEGVAKLIDFGLAKCVGTPCPAAAGDGGADMATGVSTTTTGTPADASQVDGQATSGPPERVRRSFDDRGSRRSIERSGGDGSGGSRAGLLLGTPAYMSPEQARGEPAGPESDVWSFGCLLYECLAGTPAFSGATTGEVLAAILGRPANLDRLPGSTPHRVRRVLARCIDRDPAIRLVRIEEAEHELELALAEQAATTGRVDVAVAPPPRRLPRHPGRFIGRDHELARVATLLASASLLTLTGPGGCGKTRLAIELAERCAAQDAVEVCLIELAGLSEPSMLASAIADALGIEEGRGRTPLEAIVARLVGRSFIVVLDNCEHLRAQCAEVAEQLLRACPRLTVLATSRERLGLPGEHVYQVPPLSVPDQGTADARRASAAEAVRLFVDRAKAADAGFELTDANAAAVVAVCRRLDGLPLAIELAAARTRVLAVGQIVERLDDAMRLLADDASTGSGRLRTVEAALDWSYRMLDEPERRLLCALSVFAGPWSLDAVSAVCAPGADAFDVLGLLTHLVDRSLVSVEDGQGERRYRLLETTRQYARGKLAGEEEITVLDRHLAFHLALAERAASSQGTAEEARDLDRLEAAHRDLLAALAWASAAPARHLDGLRLAAALGSYWRKRGHYTAGRLALAAALRDGATAPDALRARALDASGILAWRQGDTAAAVALHAAALRLWRRSGDRRQAAFSLNGLGNAAYAQRRYAAARRLHERALAVREALGDERGVASSLTNLGNVAYDQADYGRARVLHGRSLAISQRIGDRWGEASSLNNLGNIAFDLGEWASARDLHERSLEIKRGLGDRWGIGASYINLGNVARKSGDTRAAMRCYGQAIAIDEELGDRLTIAEILEAAGDLAARRGEHDRSARLLGGAERLRDEIGSPLAPNERGSHERLVAELRAGLGAGPFDRCWREGMTVAPEALVNETKCWLRDAAQETVHVSRDAR